MAADHMVLLRTVPSSFHARVLAARLGADGIPTQLRGAVDGLYPMGDVMVYVVDRDFEVAQELLLADEVESAFDSAEDSLDWSFTRRLPPWVAMGMLFLLALGCMVVMR